MGEDLVGRPAVELAGLVRAGEIDPVDLLTAHFDAITERDDRIRSFQGFRRGPAFEDARELERRIRLDDPDLGPLPLAGVPIAIKDELDVAGLPTRKGSLATSPRPASEDAEVVRRLRDAGAIVVGKTRVPEFFLWAFTESAAFGATHNPWDPALSPGGSSGGSAAAVAAGMTPLALGSDGLGSIRIPAAACGLFGIKPGDGAVPRTDFTSDWGGMAEWGPLATTVADAALMLDVLADRTDLRDPAEPRTQLRIAVSEKPMVPVPVAGEMTAAVARTATELRDAGHTVAAADPPIPAWAAFAIEKRRKEGLLVDLDAAPGDQVELRTRSEARLARALRSVARADPDEVRRFRRSVEGFFAEHDLLLTPSIPKRIGEVGENDGRGFVGTYVRQLPYATFMGQWNLAGYPAASVPAGLDRDGIPIGVQLVAPRGGEGLLLSVARQLEARRPWPRHAPDGAG